MVLRIKVKPGASVNKVLTDADGNFILKIKAPPIEGRANDELIHFLASILKIPKSRITIVAGRNILFKKIEINGLEETEVINMLTKQLN